MTQNVAGEEDEEALLENQDNNNIRVSRLLPVSGRFGRLWVGIALLSLALFAMEQLLFHYSSAVPEGVTERKSSTIISGDDARLMVCPDAFQHDEVFNSNHDYYEGHSLQIMTNLSAFLEVFREEKYDKWGKTYNKVMRLMLPWKQRVFSHVRSGWTLYESACGIGLNLFMTLEILESMNITNITVYGNEYAEASVQVARRMGEQLPGRGKVGNICAGDSSNLSFVPSNSFDAVFTGYVTPLRDPLGTGLDDVNIDPYYEQICEGNDETNLSLRRKQQRIQDDWYAVWASELIRIAKPGAWIVMEQISLPVCEAQFDWGGVHPSFWYRAVRSHEQFQNVDQDSIEFEKDYIFRRRYHVRFQKLHSSGEGGTAY